jgi:hypothetical protein
MKKLELVNDILPIVPRANAPRSISNVIDDIVIIRSLLSAEQEATKADRQKVVEAVEETRTVINRVLDDLVELLRGSMNERVASVETVIGSPT